MPMMSRKDRATRRQFFISHRRRAELLRADRETDLALLSQKISQLPEDERTAVWERVMREQDESWQSLYLTAGRQPNKWFPIGVAMGLMVPLSIALTAPLFQSSDPPVASGQTTIQVQHRDAAMEAGRAILEDTGTRFGMTAEELNSVRNLTLTFDSARFDTSDYRYQPGASPTAVIFRVGSGKTAFPLVVSPRQDPDTRTPDFQHSDTPDARIEIYHSLRSVIDNRDPEPPRTTATGMGATEVSHPPANVVAQGTVRVGSTPVSFSVTRPAPRDSRKLAT